MTLQQPLQRKIYRLECALSKERKQKATLLAACNKVVKRIKAFAEEGAGLNPAGCANLLLTAIAEAKL